MKCFCIIQLSIIEPFSSQVKRRPHSLYLFPIADAGVFRSAYRSSCIKPSSNHLLQVFLSATLANATEFAAWVAHLHKQPCHVVYTDFRPTPLQHLVYPVVSEWAAWQVLPAGMSSFPFLKQ